MRTVIHYPIIPKAPDALAMLYFTERSLKCFHSKREETSLKFNMIKKHASHTRKGLFPSLPLLEEQRFSCIA